MLNEFKHREESKKEARVRKFKVRQKAIAIMDSSTSFMAMGCNENGIKFEGFVTDKDMPILIGSLEAMVKEIKQKMEKSNEKSNEAQNG